MSGLFGSASPLVLARLAPVGHHGPVGGSDRQQRRWLAAFVVVVLALATVLVAPSTAAAPGQFDAVFRVDLEQAAIDVTIRVGVKSQAHERRFHVPADAEEISVTAGGNPIPVTVGDLDEFASIAAAAIPAGQDDVELRYTIPSGPPRTVGHARVNPAHISFVAWVDPELGQGSVRIELPPGFRGASFGGDLSIRSDDADGQVWMADRIHSTDLWTEFVARNEGGLARSSVPLPDGTEVKIAGWADDPEWIAFAEEAVSWAVPMLEDLIGQRWPTEDLVVIESTEPNAFGAAGWFSVWDSEIAVDDRLDINVMVHELAHAWFNYLRLEERWLVEGWAEDYSALAISEHTGEQVVPPEPDLTQDGTSNLDSWGRAGWDGDAEWNAYQTSWYVLHTIREEIGTETMAEVFATLLGGLRSYHADGDPIVHPPNTTARFLDVVENVGGSELASELLGEYVLGPAWAPRLELRDSARAGYDRLAATGWSVPPLVRDQLEAWKFEVALPAIERAEAIVARITALDELARSAGSELPDSIVAAYEGARTDFAAVEQELERAEAAFGADLDLEPTERSSAIGDFVAASSPAPRTASPADTDNRSLLLLAGVLGLGAVVVGFAYGQVRAARRL